MHPQPDLSARMKESAARTTNAVGGILPVLLGVLLLASMLAQLIPKLIDSGVFGHAIWLDTLVASILGSLSTAQPIVSYVFGGELLKSGIDLLAVTALIVTWVTVGVIPLPAEAVALGWRFALWRNLWAFVAALLVSVLTIAGMHVIQG